MHCSLPHNLKLLLLASFTCVLLLALPTHLYMYQLFTHSLLAHHHLCYVDVYCVSILFCLYLSIIVFLLLFLMLTVRHHIANHCHFYFPISSMP